LGPEGGDAGGRVVGVGTPQHIMRSGRFAYRPRAARGRASRASFGRERTGCGILSPRRPKARRDRDPRRARAQPQEHRRESRPQSLHGDHRRFRQRQEHAGVRHPVRRRAAPLSRVLNAYARQFVQPASRPDVEAIIGIPPTVAIEQRTSRGGRKSTVATLTEIYHFLRLLYVKLGVQYCPTASCRSSRRPRMRSPRACSRSTAASRSRLLAPLIVARKGLYTALAKWARGKGYAQLRVDGVLRPTAKWPRLDRFVSTTSKLPVATLTVSAGAEPNCAPRSSEPGA
jgi:excinuclease ABC subunit A